MKNTSSAASSASSASTEKSKATASSRARGWEYAEIPDPPPLSALAWKAPSVDDAPPMIAITIANPLAGQEHKHDDGDDDHDDDDDEEDKKRNVPAPSCCGGSVCTSRFVAMIVPTTIVALVSGCLGLVGAAVVFVLALVVVSAACVLQFFEWVVKTLVKMDVGLSTCADHPRPPRSNNKRQALDAKSAMLQLTRGLVDLWCDLLALGFFQTTIGISYCCAIYGAVVVPTLIFVTSGSTSVFYAHTFSDAPVGYAMIHAGILLFAIAWLFVTGHVSRVLCR